MHVDVVADEVNANAANLRLDLLDCIPLIHSHSNFRGSCVAGKLGLATLKTIQKMSQELPKVVFVLGGPGAGKGTQCAKIVEVTFNLVFLKLLFYLSLLNHSVALEIQVCAFICWRFAS